MDLLIAGTALVEGAPLVTRNPSHFERVPDLRVLEY
jgi:predicted nucleic acid-binding protein